MFATVLEEVAEYLDKHTRLYTSMNVQYMNIYMSVCEQIYECM